jgi:hypothetical protein
LHTCKELTPHYTSALLPVFAPAQHKTPCTRKRTHEFQYFMRAGPAKQEEEEEEEEVEQQQQRV